MNGGSSPVPHTTALPHQPRCQSPWLPAVCTSASPSSPHQLASTTEFLVCTRCTGATHIMTLQLCQLILTACCSGEKDARWSCLSFCAVCSLASLSSSAHLCCGQALAQNIPAHAGSRGQGWEVSHRGP